jgi:hypothetical protein
MFCPAPSVWQGGARPACCLCAGCKADEPELRVSLNFQEVNDQLLPCPLYPRVACINNKLHRSGVPQLLGLPCPFGIESCISFFSFLAAQVCPLLRHASPSSIPRACRIDCPLLKCRNLNKALGIYSLLANPCPLKVTATVPYSRTMSTWQTKHLGVGLLSFIAFTIVTIAKHCPHLNS